MKTIKRVIPSSKHLVSLAGNRFILPESFEYHLKDREFLHKFNFRKHKGHVPPNGDHNFRVGDQVYPILLNPDFIHEESFDKSKRKEPGRSECIYEVSGWIQIEYFTTSYNRIIINSQGYIGNLHGQDNNFLRIGEMLKKGKCGSFVMYQHTGLWNLLGDIRYSLESISSDLQDVIDYCFQNSFKICFYYDPQLYLSGYSMGAGATAITGGKDPRVKKMLLIAPSPEKRETLVKKWLGQYEGEVYFVHGKSDEVIPYRYSRIFSKAAVKAKKVDLLQILECGHDFAGDKLQKEFLNSYRRVFARKK